MSEQTILLNNRLSMTFPEGFSEMDAETLAAKRFSMDGAGTGLSDPERHMIVSIGWEKSAFAAFVLNEKDLAKKSEENIRVPMKQYGYVLKGFSSGTIAGRKARGFRYEYSVQETDMTAECWVFKYDKTFYYLNYYTRSALIAENEKVWQDVLASARLIQAGRNAV